MAKSNIERALTVFRGIGERDAELATRFMHPTKYTPHNSHVSDGIAGMKEWIGQLPRDKSSLKTVRAFQDGPYVFSNTVGDVHGEKVLFDIFKFEDGLIVEHWSFDEQAAPRNKSGHTQTDGPTDAQHLEDTEKNKSFVRRYYEIVHLGGDHSKIPHFISTDHNRHEPEVSDGVAAFLQDLKSFNEPGKPSRTVDEIKLLLGHGDLVFIGATGTIAGDPSMYVDLYRVEGDKLVEHWGFMDKFPPPEQSKNNNGVL